MTQRRAGLIQVQINGVIYDAKGHYSYNLGLPKRTAIVGADRVHGFREEPQVAMIEGEITDRGNLDVAALVSTQDATVTLTLASGKMVTLHDAWFAGDGNVSTEEAQITVRFEGPGPADEVS